MYLKDIKPGQKIRVVYYTGNGNTGVDGVFGEVQGNFCILHNNIRVAEYSPNISSPNLDYQYAMIINGPTLDHAKANDKRLISIQVILPDILMKKDATGTSFRRIYKEEKDLLYLGTIQKDIELCYTPSPMISIVDKAYAESKGWTYYHPEPSAEEKLQRKKPTVPTQ